MTRITAALTILGLVLAASIVPGSATIRDGAPTGANQPAGSVVTSARDPLNGRRSPLSAASSRQLSGSAETAVGAPITGTATWYDAPSIHDAAAGPPLRHGHWRGSTVRVCAKACITVRLTDWCACPHHVIDLDDQAFRRLARLSVGVVRVTVERRGTGPLPRRAVPTAPPTDTTTP